MKLPSELTQLISSFLPKKNVVNLIKVNKTINNDLYSTFVFDYHSTTKDIHNFIERSQQIETLIVDNFDLFHHLHVKLPNVKKIVVYSENSIDREFVQEYPHATIEIFENSKKRFDGRY